MDDGVTVAGSVTMCDGSERDAAEKEDARGSNPAPLLSTIDDDEYS